MTNRIEIEKLRYWCHKILPLVYDDSLSYYELLCRVTAKINEIIEAIGDLPSGKQIVDSEDITVEEVENEIKLYLVNPSANGLYRHAIEFTPADGVYTKFTFINDKVSAYTAYNTLRDAMAGQYITGLYEADGTKRGVTIYVSDDGTKIMKLDGTTEEDISASFFDTVTAI